MPLIKLMRPNQWVKNGFLFIGLIFGHAWTEPAMVRAVLLGFAAFCLASSAVYVFNDLRDREQDRRHPTKRLRPLASGAVSSGEARVLIVLLLAGALLLGRYADPRVMDYVAAYLVLNLFYTLRFKQIVLLDIFCISAGFMLRILAGTDGVGIPPSNWLLFCGLWTTLFLGFIKRRAEITRLGDDGAGHRQVLGQYSTVLLDKLIGITCTGMILSYSLYTMDADVRRIHGTDHLMYTVPFVIYACFRYLYQLHQQESGGDPSRDLLRDPHILVAGALWLATTIYLIAT